MVRTWALDFGFGQEIYFVKHAICPTVTLYQLHSTLVNIRRYQSQHQPLPYTVITLGHVMSSAMWPLNLLHTVSYRWSFETITISGMVAEILAKHIKLKMHWSLFSCVLVGKIGGCSIFNFAHGAETHLSHYNPQLVHGPHNCIWSFPLKMHYRGENWFKMGKEVAGWSPTNLFLLFGPQTTAKFHQNWINISTTKARTDREKDASDCIICLMLCYWTDNKKLCYH